MFCNVSVTLSNESEWEKMGPMPEMLIAKKGRRIVPGLQYYVTGLDPKTEYTMHIMLQKTDGYKYQFNKQKDEWLEHSNSPDRPIEELRHKDGKLPGADWMANVVDFSYIKITNKPGIGIGEHLLVQAQHKYQPSLVIRTARNPADQFVWNNVRQQFMVVTNYTVFFNSIRKPVVSDDSGVFDDPNYWFKPNKRKAKSPLTQQVNKRSCVQAAEETVENCVQPVQQVEYYYQPVQVSDQLPTQPVFQEQQQVVYCEQYYQPEQINDQVGDQLPVQYVLQEQEQTEYCNQDFQDCEQYNYDGDFCPEQNEEENSQNLYNIPF